MPHHRCHVYKKVTKGPMVHDFETLPIAPISNIRD